MGKKSFVDMMICSLSAAIVVLCYSYMEQGQERELILIGGCIIFAVFLVLAVIDLLSIKGKNEKSRQGIQELLLLD